MGGLGSGRRKSARQVVEDAPRLDLAWLMAEGCLRPGLRTRGSLQWPLRQAGQPILALSYEADLSDPAAAWMRMADAITGSSGTVRHEEEVRIVTTAPHYGGRRHWFVCPILGSRARVLHRPLGARRFASRAAYRLDYRSQRQTELDRILEKNRAVRQRLGVDTANLLDRPLLSKPKGMHWNTYVDLVLKLSDLHQELQDMSPFPE